MLKSVRMPTVWLPMCSTGAPMARSGGGNIPGNNLGQGFTSPSTFTHVPGAYGARTGAVGGAADRHLTVTFGERHVPSSSPFMFPLHGRTQWVVRSAATKRGHEWRRTGCMAFNESHRQTPIGSLSTAPVGAT